MKNVLTYIIEQTNKLRIQIIQAQLNNILVLTNTKVIT